MKSLTKCLIKQLKKNHWELKESFFPNQLWATEIWAIQSTISSDKDFPGLLVWVSFSISHDGSGAVNHRDTTFIIASRYKPNSLEIEDDNFISEVFVTKKSELEHRISDFILDINQFRLMQVSALTN